MFNDVPMQTAGFGHRMQMPKETQMAAWQEWEWSHGMSLTQVFNHSADLSARQ